MDFRVCSKDKNSKARNGELKTDHNVIKTPVFMPVGTAGTVKAVHFNELTHEVKAPIILANTYHLYLRPGMDVLRKAGGVHAFNSWKGSMLTDSGGYQVYSLAENRKITEEGVHFKSHIDGSRHFFTPESVMDIQREIGADIIMAFDECAPYPCDFTYARKSMEMTHRWLKRCISRFNETSPHYGHSQVLFPIIQGSVYPELRKISAEFVVSMDLPGNAIGGLSVGEPADIMYDITDQVTDILPESKPRYLMGVGTPANLLECIARGIDMFDCVMPTRNARNGMLFTSEGIINIRNEKWKTDFSPIDPAGLCTTDLLHTKAYLRHLMVNGEMLGAQLASIHNLSFYLWLVNTAREKIEEGSFLDWKNEMVPKLAGRL